MNLKFRRAFTYSTIGMSRWLLERRELDGRSAVENGRPAGQAGPAGASAALDCRTFHGAEEEGQGGEACCTSVQAGAWNSSRVWVGGVLLAI